MTREPRMIKILNGRIITPFRILEKASILISDGKILEISQGDFDAPDAMVIDAQGQYVAPGFIDIHVHGGGGYDFMDNTELAFLKIAEAHAKFGTTSIVPTTLTCDKEAIFTTFKCYEDANRKNDKGAQFIGMHLEGPYFAMNQRGAQDPRFIRNPDPAEYNEILESTNVIKRWSAAPELPGALEFARVLREKGILAALAHTDAIYEEVLEGFENGYTLATHLYSGMSGVTRRNAYRYAGAVESAFIIDKMDVEIIADGVHLPASLLKLIYKIKGPGRIALITDAMRAAGMPEGDSVLGNCETGLKVIVEDGVAKLPDRTAFAGSVATADRLVRTMVNLAEVPLIEAIEMITATPARIMGVEATKGSLVKGKDADIIIFDENINVKTTIVNGRVVYQAI
jgi:N-acetylglucosamine-6-phosphate deacetylase